MNPKELVPKNKFDIETAEKLFQYSFDEVETVIRSILEWLQDGNWPVSKPVGNYIKSLNPDLIGPYLMEIMNGPDYEWKYFLLSIFDEHDLENGYQPFITEINRLVDHPTETEIACEVHWMARRVMNLED